MDTDKLEQTAPEERPSEAGEAAAKESGGEITASAAAGQETTPEEKRDARPSWEEILADPAYKSRYDAAVQSIVKSRLRGRQRAEEKLQRLEPVLRALEECYGMGEDFDAASIAAALRGSAGLHRPSDGEIAAHLDALLREAEALREQVPGFDLLRELEDPDFLRMTAPHSGVRLADAYYARHRADLQRETARRSLEAVSRSVRSLGTRPRELRDEEGGFPAADPRQMSREEREALKRRIREASARGKRLGVGE